MVIENIKMEKIFIYGFNLQFLFDKINPALSEHFELKYYNGFTKIKQRNFILSPLIVLISLFSAIFKILKFKPDYLILISSKASMISPLVFLFKRKIKIIYFPYDVMTLFYKNSNLIPWYDRKAEKYCFKYCKGIILKGAEERFIPKYFDIKGKPIFHLHLLSKTDFCKIESKENKEIHICDVCLTAAKKNDPDQFSEQEIIKILIDKGLHVHVYTREKHKVEFEDIIEHPFFHFEGYLNGKDMFKSLGKYDYGLHIYLLKKNSRISEEFSNSTFGNREFDYVAAGIPIITFEGSYIGEFVKTNGLGFVLTLSEFEKIDIQDLINKRNSFFQHIEKVRENFAIENEIEKLVSFIDSIR